ncbi:MAG: formate dehydrogenase accessory sulfurtransferase FdhD [Sphingomonadales bacterium]
MADKNSKTTLSLAELRPGETLKGNRVFASEVPVALIYNGVSHVVMMATPSDLEDFALGFSLSEEIISNPGEITAIDITEAEKGYIAKIEIPVARFEALIQRGRNLVGQTGCGLCGVAELEEAVRAYPKIKTKPKINKKILFKTLETISDHQPLNQDTGAVHGAAFVDWEGTILALMEDVGRHNAFDKLIGHMARAGMDFRGGFAVLTSRGSFELVQKALSVGIPMLVTVSAPTDLAITLARDHDLTLVALARADSMLAVNDPFDLFL